MNLRHYVDPVSMLNAIREELGPADFSAIEMSLMRNRPYLSWRVSVEFAKKLNAVSPPLEDLAGLAKASKTAELMAYIAAALASDAFTPEEREMLGRLAAERSL